MLDVVDNKPSDVPEPGGLREDQGTGMQVPPLQGTVYQRVEVEKLSACVPECVVTDWCVPTAAQRWHNAQIRTFLRKITRIPGKNTHTWTTETCNFRAKTYISMSTACTQIIDAHR